MGFWSKLFSSSAPPKEAPEAPPAFPQLRVRPEPPEAARKRRAQLQVVDVVPGLRVHISQEDALGGPCWTFLSEGFAPHGQREISISLKRRPGEPWSAYPAELLSYFEAIFPLAQAGKFVGPGDCSEVGPHGIVERHFRGVIFAETPEVPALVGILAYADELDLARKIHAQRVLTRLGAATRHFPFPRVTDRDRPSVVKPGDDASILHGVPRVRLPKSSASWRGANGIVQLADSEHARVTSAFDQVGTSNPIAWLTGAAPGADGAFLWHPGQQGPAAISAPGGTGGPSSTAAHLSGAFLLLVPNETTSIRPFEDGLALLLAPDAWGAVVTALREHQDLRLTGADGTSTLELSWVSDSYLDPFSGAALPGMQTFAPAERRRGEESVVLLTSDAATKAAVDVADFSAYLERIFACIREGLAPPETGAGAREWATFAFDLAPGRPVDVRAITDGKQPLALPALATLAPPPCAAPSPSTSAPRFPRAPSTETRAARRSGDAAAALGLGDLGALRADQFPRRRDAKAVLVDAEIAPACDGDKLKRVRGAQAACAGAFDVEMLGVGEEDGGGEGRHRSEHGGEFFRGPRHVEAARVRRDEEPPRLVFRRPTAGIIVQRGERRLAGGAVGGGGTKRPLAAQRGAPAPHGEGVETDAFRASRQVKTGGSSVGFANFRGKPVGRHAGLRRLRGAGNETERENNGGRTAQEPGVDRHPRSRATDVPLKPSGESLFSLRSSIGTRSCRCARSGRRAPRTDLTHRSRRLTYRPATKTHAETVPYRAPACRRPLPKGFLHAVDPSPRAFCMP
jgi:hypothetical protein